MKSEYNKATPTHRFSECLAISKYTSTAPVITFMCARNGIVQEYISLSTTKQICDERVIITFSSPGKDIKDHENENEIEATVCPGEDALRIVHSVTVQQSPAGKLDLADTAVHATQSSNWVFQRLETKERTECLSGVKNGLNEWNLQLHFISRSLQRANARVILPTPPMPCTPTADTFLWRAAFATNSKYFLQSQ